MNADMMLLAERLVLAMETISQDVKNMSAYVYDLNYSVSLFINGKKGNVGVSVVTSNEYGSLPCDPPSFADGDYSLQCDQLNDSPVPHIDDTEHEEMSVQDVGCVSKDEAVNSDVLASFTAEVMTEEALENEDNDMDNTSDNGSNIVRVNLDRHMLVHTGAKPYSCQQCGVAYKQKKALMDHMLRHSGERPYQCSQCPKNYSQAQSLRYHTYSHHGQKPIICEVCAKSFAQRGDLTDHMRIHTGERPYRCPHCGKSFTQGSALKRHIRIHTGERPYACTSCEMRFSRKELLKNHMERTH